MLLEPEATACTRPNCHLHLEAVRKCCPPFAHEVASHVQPLCSAADAQRNLAYPVKFACKKAYRAAIATISSRSASSPLPLLPAHGMKSCTTWYVGYLATATPESMTHVFLTKAERR